MAKRNEDECAMCDSVIEFDQTTRLYLQHFCGKSCAEKYIANKAEDKLPWRHEINLDSLEESLRELGFEKQF
jgi:hypothetical protein